eukprot:10373309-Heterocapsa_arctica.AAC.1
MVPVLRPGRSTEKVRDPKPSRLPPVNGGTEDHQVSLSGPQGVGDHRVPEEDIGSALGRGDKAEASVVAVERDASKHKVPLFPGAGLGTILPDQVGRSTPAGDVSGNRRGDTRLEHRSEEDPVTRSDIPPIRDVFP